MIVAVSGIRDLAPESEADIEMTVLDWLPHVDEMRFGGARGSDTVALVTAGLYRDETETILRVFVPGRVADQPREARPAITKFSDEVVELGGDVRHPRAYFARNTTMLNGADVLIAFTDGRGTGGTALSIALARAKGIRLEVVPVRGTKYDNPRLRLTLGESLAPIYGIWPYVSRRSTGRIEGISETIRRLKVGAAEPAAIEKLAEGIAAYVGKHPAFHLARYIAAMPKRMPGIESDLEPLAAVVARITPRLTHLPGGLVRTAPPADGRIRAYRERFPWQAHADTMRVAGPKKSRVIILDNVLTGGTTMFGAQHAVQRDTGYPPLGLAILWSGTLGTKRARHV